SAVCWAITKLTRSVEFLILVELLPTTNAAIRMASNPTVLAPATMNLSGLTAMSRWNTTMNTSGTYSAVIFAWLTTMGESNASDNTAALNPDRAPFFQSASRQATTMHW